MPDGLRVSTTEATRDVEDRLVVAIGECPGGPELVRAAKRLADALSAPWTAVHIETSRNAGFSVPENRQLAETMHLVTQLGGEVATLPAPSVVDGLRAFALQARATQLIVGQPERSRWSELWHGTVAGALLRAMQGVAVHVVPLDVMAPRPRTGSALADDAWGSLGGYAVSLGLVVVVTMLGSALFAQDNIFNAGLLFLIPVMVAATRYGLRTGIVTGLVSSLAYNFFFVEPTLTFTIEDPQNIVTVLVLLGVAIVSSQLAARVREQALLAQASSAQNSSLAGFAGRLTRIRTGDELAHVVCTEVARLFEGNTIILFAEDDQLKVRASCPAPYVLEMLDEAAARWAFENSRPAGRGGNTLTTSEWLFCPVGGEAKVMAVLGLSRQDAHTPVRPDQLPLLASLLDQAGLALQRIALEEEMAGLARVRERDRLRQALLSSVSHDLRTPLTTVLASLDELRTISPGQAALVDTTRREADRLRRFVGNLLDMVRIEAGSLQQHIEPVDLAEALASALEDLAAVLRGHTVETRIGADLPLVVVDPQLFHHCLINLIDNAAKYAGPGSKIAIGADRLPDGLLLLVEDEGPGIPEGEAERIFETFTRIEGSDRKGGTGLGLAIVKGFAEAMGLEVQAANRSGGRGASFSIRFGIDQVRECPEA